MNREQIGKLAKARALIREAQLVVGALVDASPYGEDRSRLVNLWLRLDDESVKRSGVKPPAHETVGTSCGRRLQDRC